MSGEESEGCLLDCVNDCVAITELRAYKEWDRTTRLLTKSTVHYDTTLRKIYSDVASEYIFIKIKTDFLAWFDGFFCCFSKVPFDIT